MFHVPHESRVTTGSLASASNDGNNGAFQLQVRGVTLFAIASDGLGWEHVSIHKKQGRKTRTPNWDEMCAVKDMFWDAEDAVVQFHPPKSSYVNDHPHVLHLWRPIEAAIPLPDPIMVGAGNAR